MEELEKRRENDKTAENTDPDLEDDVHDNWDNTKVLEDSDDEDPDYFSASATSQDGLDHHDEEEGANAHLSQSTGEPPPPPRKSGIKRPLVPYDLLMNSTSDEDYGDAPYHPAKRAKRSPQKRMSKEGVKEVELSSDSSDRSSGSSTRNSSPHETPPEMIEEEKDDDLPEFDIKGPDFLVISDGEEEEEKKDYFPIRILPPGTFCLPKHLTPPTVSFEILDGQQCLDAQASSESFEICLLSSEEPDEGDDTKEYYKVVDPQQIVSINEFRKAFFPRFSLEDEDEEQFMRRIFFEPTPPSPEKPPKTTEQLDKEELVYWQEADDPPETIEREKFRFIKITTRKKPLGKVILTMQETWDSPVTVQLLEDHVAFGKVLDIASYFLIEELVLDMLKVNNEKYINYLSETIELLPIRYLDWWNYKPLNTPNRYSGYQLNRFLKRCDPRFLRKLSVRFDRWNYDAFTDAREDSDHWRNLREFETNMRLPAPLQRCLHFNNFKIKVHEFHISEWEPLLVAFQKKLPICPPPSFDIQTEMDVILTPIDDEAPFYEFPLYIHANMFTSSLHTLLVKIDKNSVTGRVIDKVEVDELPEILEWVFSDDFYEGY